MDIHNLPCLKESCGSSDAVTLYEDGHAFCFSCRSYFYNGDYPRPTETYNNKGKKKLTKVELTKLPDEYVAIPDRGITMEAAKKFNIKVKDGKHAYTYTKKGKPTSIQYRDEDKNFTWENHDDKLDLFGQSVFPAGSARQITIVEGALDAPSAWLLTGSRYPVVAVSNAGNAEKEVKNNIEYLNSFETIVICMDNDKPGQEAAERMARALPVGKVRMVKLQHGKDANEYLTKPWINNTSNEAQFTREWFQGAPWTPSGLRLGNELWEDIINVPKVDSIPWPWVTIQQQTYGLRKSEVTIIHAKTGVGKSTVLNEIEYAILQANEGEEKLGLLRLEEQNRDSALGLMSIHLNKRLHLPDVWEQTSEDEIRKAYDEVINTDRIVLWDHFGSNNIEEVLSKIRYMNALGCEHIIIDHLSIIVSDQSGDERKQLDEISTKLKMLCMERNIGVIAVIHENRSGEIRGSAGVEQLGNTVIQLERDVKSNDPFRRAVTKMTIEKCRFTGETGPSSYLFFEKDTGRLRDLGQADIDRYEAHELS